MQTIISMALSFLLIVLLSAGIAYLIMRWCFSPKRHAELVHKFDGINISGLNAGAIVLLSLGIAFVFSDISNVHIRAKTSLLQEADALRTLGRISLNIEPEVGTPLMDATRAYASDVLQKEWPAMRQGDALSIRQGTRSALTPLTVMSDIVYDPFNFTKLQPLTASQLGNLVARIREYRLVRIEISEYRIGSRGLTLAILTLVASSVILSMAMLKKPASQFLCIFSFFVVSLFALYLAYASQNPFSGLDAISNAPLQEASDRLKIMKLN
jgi:hypothetical protein